MDHTMSKTFNWVRKESFGPNSEMRGKDFHSYFVKQFQRRLKVGKSEENNIRCLLKFKQSFGLKNIY